MVWFVVMEIFSTLLDWVRLGQKSESEKTLEILLLRRQLAIVERTLDKPIRPSREEKLTLAVLTTKLKAGTGRVHFAGCTAHLDQAWVTQPARQLTWALPDRPPDVKPMRFLIHDRDTKFTQSFDNIVLSEGVGIVLTPYRAPKANAFAERWSALCERSVWTAF